MFCPAYVFLCTSFTSSLLRHAPSGGKGAAAESSRAADMDVSQVLQLSHSVRSRACFRTNPCIRATFTWRSSKSFALSSPAPFPLFETHFQSYDYCQILARWRYQFLRAQGRHDFDRELRAGRVCEGEFGADKGQIAAVEEPPQHKQAGSASAHSWTWRSFFSFASAILTGCPAGAQQRQCSVPQRFQQKFSIGHAPPNFEVEVSSFSRPLCSN